MNHKNCHKPALPFDVRIIAPSKTLVKLNNC
nr:MAG TPA: hypothetical protein [Caudoviricetes sp.]